VLLLGLMSPGRSELTRAPGLLNSGDMGNIGVLLLGLMRSECSGCTWEPGLKGTGDGLGDRAASPSESDVASESSRFCRT
jgi:hypothetical protein